MLLLIVRALVDHPVEAEILLLSHAKGSIFYSHAHPRDVTRLIGNCGQNVSALRCIVGSQWRGILADARPSTRSRKQVDHNENALITIRSLLIPRNEPLA